MGCVSSKKKIKKIEPSPVRPLTPTPYPSPSQRRQDDSDKLNSVLEHYRISHPNILVVDCPKYGLSKTEMRMY